MRFNKLMRGCGNVIQLLVRGGNRRSIRGWQWYSLGEVALSKLLDRLHNVDQCQSFLGQAILDPWRDLQEGLPLHKADLF